MLEHLYDIEKQKNISDEFRELYPQEIRQAPDDWFTYNLCMLFHCLPDEIDRQDFDRMMSIVTLHNTYQDVEESYSEMKERMNKNKKGKGEIKISKHLAIALEIEKIKAKK